MSIFNFVFAGIRKFPQRCLSLMGKIKHNLRRHSQSLKPLKMVKKLPDAKRSKMVAGLKDKMKRPKIKKVVKRKAGWTSEARVSCEWCPSSFSR